AFKRPQDLKKHEKTHADGDEEEPLAITSFDYDYYNSYEQPLEQQELQLQQETQREFQQKYEYPQQYPPYSQLPPANPQFGTPVYNSVSPYVGSIGSPDRQVPSSALNNNMSRKRQNSPQMNLAVSPHSGYASNSRQENKYYYPPPPASNSAGKRGADAIERFQQTVKKCRTDDTSQEFDTPLPDSSSSMPLLGVISEAASASESEAVGAHIQSLSLSSNFSSKAPTPIGHNSSRMSISPAASPHSPSNSSSPPPLSAASSWSSEASLSSIYSSYSRPFSSTRSTTFCSKSGSSGGCSSGSGGGGGMKGSLLGMDFARHYPRKPSVLDAPPLLRSMGQHTYHHLSLSSASSSTFDRFAMDDYE
ncbi:hypothetical protein GGF37_006315, partial [Kickxella alabastrina]